MSGVCDGRYEVTPEKAYQDTEKKNTLEECIAVVHAEAVKLAEKDRPTEEIQATIRSIARAYLSGAKIFSENEISMVVDSMKIGRKL